MIPPPRLDPRVPLLASALVLAAVAVAPQVRPTPAAVTSPAASVPGSASPGSAPTEPVSPGSAGSETARPGAEAGPDLGWLPPDLALLSSAWLPPVGPPVVVARAFDPPATPYGPGHRGVDLLARAGDTVRAAGAGVVSFARPVAGRGVIVVGHGELRTTYEPVTATVEVGTQVAAGDILGHLDLGHPGCPDGPKAAESDSSALPEAHSLDDADDCLHWGLLRGDVYLDPMTLLNPPRPRLLPLGDGNG